MREDDLVIDWLLDPEHSDPSIRWQVMRDLLDAPTAEWEAERTRVETEGWGARLLAHEDDDGRWAGGAHFPADFDWKGDEPGQPWTSTTHSLSQLREFGIQPSDRTRRAVELIGANCHWEHYGQPYWEGEVEPCINGMTVANGSYFGVDMAPVVERLVGERLEDGGWNCEAENGSVRSSFDSTINVLEGLLEYERASGGTPESHAARRAGEEYLLKRHLFRRLSTGEAPDPRLGEAIEHLRSRRRDDGKWPLDWNPTGRVWFDVDDGQGEPSRWLTLRALRVLRWWDAAEANG
jgi:hypothetical protein